MGEKKDKAKSILGFIALGCALAVACVVAAPALAVVGVVVGTTTLISASTVVGVTAAVAAVGATAAVTKAALHVSDGEYQEALESAVMAVPLASTAYAYGNAYVGMTSTSGRMVTGSSASQAGSQTNPKPNQTAGDSSGQGSTSWRAPAGYTLDANGRWHRPNGQFASNAEMNLPPGAQTVANRGWYNADGTINYPPYPGSVPGTEKNVTLQPGQVVGRYGEIKPKTVFTTDPNASSKSLSLPPNTSPSTYTEIQVLKPIEVKQATIAEWPIGSGNGGGTQYVFPRPLSDLDGDFIKIIK